MDCQLKEKIRSYIEPIVNSSELSDFDEYTTNSIESQKEYLKRLVMERSENPLNEVDCIAVVETLNEDSICPFINGHLAKDS